jgi:hypothetical protein
VRALRDIVASGELDASTSMGPVKAETVNGEIVLERVAAEEAGPGEVIALAGNGKVLTAGGIDSHIHFICPQQIDDALEALAGDAAREEDQVVEFDRVGDAEHPGHRRGEPDQRLPLADPLDRAGGAAVGGAGSHGVSTRHLDDALPTRAEVDHFADPSRERDGLPRVRGDLA